MTKARGHGKIIAKATDCLNESFIRRPRMKKHDVDVLVVGGGAAGVGAAIAAARNGARTMLVESAGMFGGTWTMGLQNHVTSFHDHGKIVIRGIPLEIMKRLHAAGDGEDPEIKFKESFKNWWVCFDTEGLKYLLDVMIIEAGVIPLLHAFAVDALVKDGRICGVSVVSKNGRQTISAKVVIDCTGDADIANYAGVETVKGRADGKMQPVTTTFFLIGADQAAVYKSATDKRPEIDRLEDEARKRGELSVPVRLSYCGTPTSIPGMTYHNTTRILNVDATSAEDLTRAEIEGRRQVREIVTFFKKNVPGYENARLLMTSASVGLRETRRIKGAYTLKKEDVLNGARFDDAVVCHAYYIDIHNPDGMGLEKGSDYKAYPKDGTYYQIPYRCMVPEKVENLLVAGRCISATREALGSSRTTACCMALGQAAGTAAAIAMEKGVGTSSVTNNILRERLLKDDVFLG